MHGLWGRKVGNWVRKGKGLTKHHFENRDVSKSMGPKDMFPEILVAKGTSCTENQLKTGILFFKLVSSLKLDLLFPPQKLPLLQAQTLYASVQGLQATFCLPGRMRGRRGRRWGENASSHDMPTFHAHPAIEFGKASCPRHNAGKPDTYSMTQGM